MTGVIESLNNLINKVDEIKLPEQETEIEVTNLDQIRLYLRQELAKAISPIIAKISSIKIPDSIEVKNFPKQVEFPNEIAVNNISELADLLNGIKDYLAAINFSPVINQPEINVPAPLVNVTVPEQQTPIVHLDIDKVLEALDPLKFLSDRPNKPITVRMSDGQKFMKVIQELKQSTDQLGVVYAGSSGISQDEMRTVANESSGLSIPKYDYVSRTLSAATQETYTFKTGGSSGSTVSTVVVDYTDATLGTLSAVTRT